MHIQLFVFIQFAHVVTHSGLILPFSPFNPGNPGGPGGPGAPVP